MDSVIEFRVLGPLEVVRDGVVVRLGAGKLRVVLAALLLQANRPVSIDDLVDKLWDGAAPGDARGTVQKYVMRIRRLLGGGAEDSAVRTEPDGYRITIPTGRLDLHRFSDLCAQAARAAAADDEVAESVLLTDALSLWRDVPPLSDVPSSPLQRDEVAGLVERYLQALDRRIELDLALGRHAEVLGELAALVRRHPERERFWAHRMRALHRAGRQGEALAAYREVASLLAEELGIDPGADLRAAHREVLGAARAGRARPCARGASAGRPAAAPAPHGRLRVRRAGGRARRDPRRPRGRGAPQRRTGGDHRHGRGGQDGAGRTRRPRRGRPLPRRTAVRRPARPLPQCR